MFMTGVLWGLKTGKRRHSWSFDSHDRAHQHGGAAVVSHEWDKMEEREGGMDIA